MAGRGPVPKDPSKRRRRNVEHRTIIQARSRPEAPPYPPEAVDDRIREWWLAWCTSPMAEQFLGTDWQRLRALVPLMVAYWSAVDAGEVRQMVSLAQELRLQESLLGATSADRMRLRWDVSVPDETPRRTSSSRSRLRVVDDTSA